MAMYPLLIRLPFEDKEALEELAEEQGTRKSILMRTAIREFLRRRKKISVRYP